MHDTLLISSFIDYLNVRILSDGYEQLVITCVIDLNIFNVPIRFDFILYECIKYQQQKKNELVLRAFIITLTNQFCEYYRYTQVDPTNMNVGDKIFEIRNVFRKNLIHTDS